jgi:hypothetical protein
MTPSVDYVNAIVRAIVAAKAYETNPAPERIFADVASTHPEAAAVMNDMLLRALPGILRDWPAGR